MDKFDTPYVFILVRTLVDPDDPADVDAVHTLRDALGLQARSARPVIAADYDEPSLNRTRFALLELARGYAGFARAFGRKDRVDPVYHLIGTAAAFGGLPEQEAFYLNVDPGLSVGTYRLTVCDVPVDAFWSITVYSNDGYFIPNARNVYSLNSVSAKRDQDGSVMVLFVPDSEERPNALPIAGRVELHGAPVSAAPRGARRELNLAIRTARLTD
jgi:hypothetical protein